MSDPDVDCADVQPHTDSHRQSQTVMSSYINGHGSPGNMVTHARMDTEADAVGTRRLGMLLGTQ